MLSSNLRRDAKPIPRPNPRSNPRARLIAFFGEAGESAGTAFKTVETLTGESLPIPCNSKLATVTPNCLATAFAISAARCGSVSVTVRTIKTVSRGAEAETISLSSSGVIERFNS